MPTPTIPRGLRNCNPGNLRHGPSSWQGLRPVQTDPDFCQFQTLVWGYRALAKTLLTYAERRGLTTVSDIIRRWAPPTENLTEAYVRAVCRITGLGPTERLDLRHEATLTALAAAISQHENGRRPQDWYTAGARGMDDVRDGVRMALEA